MVHVLAWVHGYPPTHNAGAEWALHELLQALAGEGHTVAVVQSRPHPGEWEGVQVYARPSSEQQMLRYARTADVVLTHLDHTPEAVRVARAVGVPVVHYVHNHRQLAYSGIAPSAADLVVFNSEWVARRVRWAGEWMVCTPIVPVVRYAITPGEHVTQVYLTASKGVATFYELARREPRRRFLGVMGSYGDQWKELIPNVVYQETTSSMRDDVYQRTRVLVMPSNYESWGRAGVEAMCSGIPVIAAPTEGLRESLGETGLYAERDDVEAWRRHLAELDDEDAWAARSAAARARAIHLEAQARRQAYELAARLRTL